MLKKEIIWREILYQAITNKTFNFTQAGLAKKFGFSLSTIFNALKIPRESGAIKVTGRNFSVIDTEKFLYLWATARNLSKEIIYETFVPENVLTIEGMMPPSVIYGAYSAYNLKYDSAPSDYGKVFVYADGRNLDEIKKRFPTGKGEPNLFILKSDAFLAGYGKTTPDVQTFADLWNMRDWYAKEFLNALKSKLF